MAPVDDYHRQIAGARERALVLVARQEFVLVDLLRDWADELADVTGSTFTAWRHVRMVKSERRFSD